MGELKEPLKAARAKHTPGPWTAVDRSGAGWQIDAKLPAGFKISGVAHPLQGDEPAFLIWTARDAFTVQIADERWVQFSTGDWESMQAANARLIAAAPDLLEVCAALVKACDTHPPVDLMQEIARVCGKARTAISKAEGRDSNG